MGKKYPLNNAGNSAMELYFSPNSVHFSLPDGIVKAQDMSAGNIITKLKNDVQIKCGKNKNAFTLYGEWRYSQAKLNEIIQNNEKLSISKVPFRPNHHKQGGEVKKIHNLLTQNYYDVGTNEDASLELMKLVGDKIFDFPKPSKLIKFLVRATTYNNKTCTVLDFFAGSGTTGHAVAQLNKEDGGNRKYILCTNNENNICEEVTYKRLTNIQDDLPHNLKYFKTKFLSKDDEDLENTLLHHVQTLIELEHGIDLKESDKATAFSLSELRKLDLSGIKTIYVRQQSHAMMEKSDLVRFEGIELIDVPEYYFAKEMREAGL